MTMTTTTAMRSKMSAATMGVSTRRRTLMPALLVQASSLPRRYRLSFPLSRSSQTASSRHWEKCKALPRGHLGVAAAVVEEAVAHLICGSFVALRTWQLTKMRMLKMTTKMRPLMTSTTVGWTRTTGPCGTVRGPCASGRVLLPITSPPSSTRMAAARHA